MASLGDDIYRLPERSPVGFLQGDVPEERRIWEEGRDDLSAVWRSDDPEDQSERA